MIRHTVAPFRGWRRAPRPDLDKWNRLIFTHCCAIRNAHHNRGGWHAPETVYFVAACPIYAVFHFRSDEF
jgi:hypothetical protein